MTRKKMRSENAPHLLREVPSLVKRGYTGVISDGGWNHSEMMRYERIYPGAGGTPAEDVITPLKDNADWMSRLFSGGQ